MHVTSAFKNAKKKRQRRKVAKIISARLHRFVSSFPLSTGGKKPASKEPKTPLE
jgi:hypothetical protein